MEQRSTSEKRVRRPAAAHIALAWVSMLMADASSAANLGDMDISELVKVRLSPFDVAEHLDQGYRASNSVSGSRFDAPIRELPFAIQAFTESFIADQKPLGLFDVARYSPSVTYRSNDFNEGNANLAIRGFAVTLSLGIVTSMFTAIVGTRVLANLVYGRQKNLQRLSIGGGN